MIYSLSVFLITLVDALIITPVEAYFDWVWNGRFVHPKPTVPRVPLRRSLRLAEKNQETQHQTDGEKRMP